MNIILEQFLTFIPSYHMWFVIGLIGVAIVAYSQDKIALEVTSIAILAALLIFFHFFPLLETPQGVDVTVERLLLGFANPALIAVIALLVVGQAVVQTGVLNEVANLILKFSKNNATIAIGLTLLVVLVTSGFLNNTPVVVIFIPILAAIVRGIDASVSKVMIPLSYAAILGGMTTLIGSSTNLLVSGTIQGLGFEPLGFFDFTLPGAVLASVGFIYVMWIAPKLLPDRASMVSDLVGEDNRKFIAQLEIDKESTFIGQTIESTSLPEFSDISIRMIQRDEHAFLPPFDDGLTLQAKDVIIVAATRKDLTQLLSQRTHSLFKRLPHDSKEMPDEDNEDTDDATTSAWQDIISVGEVVVTPTSRMVGLNLEQIAFRHKYKCVVLGIQRQSRLIRSRLTEIKLAAGDVLLVTGSQSDVLSLHNNNDMLLMEWSTEEIHPGNKAWHAGLIFVAVVGVAALDIIPITISAIAGVFGVIATGCITFRQALRAVDSQIIFIVAASLALGTALQATGGAQYLAESLVNAMYGASTPVVMSALFVCIAAITNVLSNNASAVLFTPIAISIAHQLGADPYMFIFTVIFAANCSFITPIGYQTNLLVMAPGHHKFSDFMRSGIPLALLMWGTYVVFASWYFGY